jgi:hypothetical protein
VYYMGWCEGGHEQRAAYLTISTGEWGAGTTGDDRLAVGIDVRAKGMRLAEEPVIDRPDFLGRFVPRGEAMKLGGLESLWHLADHIVVDDPQAAAVMEWLKGERESVLR